MTRLAASLALGICLGACAHPTPTVQPPDPVRAEITAAETAERARQHDVARLHYQRAVAVAKEPHSIAFARREYADTLRTWGELPEAIAQLRGAVRAVPADAAAWHDLGILLHNQGDDVGALDALEHAKLASPRDPRPRIALAALRWTRGDRGGAAAEYRALLELDVPDNVREKIQWALRELARPAPVAPSSPRS